MENVFGEVLEGTTETNTAGDTTVSTNNSTPELGHEYDLEIPGENDLEVDATNEVSSEPVQEHNDPTSQAFAQMRIQNKEFSNKINELDAIAKAAGLKGVDDLIEKSKEAQIKAEAKNKGIPEEVAKELADFREFKEQYQQDKENAIYQAKEQNLVNNLQNFISENKLSKESVNKLSDDLEKDGITNDYLMDLSKNALNRILSAYVGTNVQKNIERKEAIKQELPLNQTSKINTESINKQIDDLARQWARGY